MSVKLGFEAIEYILKKTLTKKGVKGIATIPGKAFDMRMKQLVDQMAFKMKALGYDIKTVKEKDVQGLLDSAEALAKQKPTPESLIKGKKYTDDRGRIWDFKAPETGADRYNKLTGLDKSKPFQGWKPKIVPKDDLASGGRTGYAVGKLVKGGKWFLNNLRKALNDIEADKGFKNLTPDRKEGITSEIKNLIKSIEGGGPIPDEMIQTIRHDPKFATISKPRSTDPDLYEFEDLILNYGKKGDVVDEQVKILEEFTPVGKGHASGGLAYMLGEPTYMKAGGGQVGHGPWTTGQVQQQQQQQQQQQAPRHPQQGQPNPMKMPQGIPSAAPRSMDPRVMQQQAMQKAMMGQGQQRPRMEEGGTPEIPQEFLEDFKRRKYEDMLNEYHRWKDNYERRKDLAPTQEVANGG